MFNKLFFAIVQFQHDRVRQEVERLLNVQLRWADTKAKRLQEFDQEAALHREHFLAHLTIEEIENNCRLSGNTHRLQGLRRTLGMGK